MARMVQHGKVDVIIGDWLSEMNIAWNAIVKQQNPELGYERGFLEQLEESLDDIVAQDLKVITNAGALNTRSLAREVRKLCKSRGYDVSVAAVLGDDVPDIINQLGQDRHCFSHLDHAEKQLDDWELKPVCGAAYIGCGGIVQALKSGAQIIICGRCTDASPLMGVSAWHFQWSEDDYHALAGALVAGHLTECGPYVTGANFTGFKDILDDLVDLTFPIAEINSRGECVITTLSVGGGRVTEDTVRAQILYELQGHLYLNPDVVADLSQITVEEIPGTRDRIRVSGIKGLPPPPTTKIMFTASGGYQAEANFYLNGLDIENKVKMMRRQLDFIFKDHNFTKLSIELYGTSPEDPVSQQAGTVFFRIFAQARRIEDINAVKFKVPIYALRMQAYPGYHMNLDFRTMDPKPFMELFPAIIPQDAIKVQVELGDSGQLIDIPPPQRTAEYPQIRPSYETANPVDLTSFGRTRKVPLGSIVHARSGDKADNSNIGFFSRSRYDDEYEWLKTFLTVERLKFLFGDDWYNGDTSRRIERVEFVGIKAVHLYVTVTNPLLIISWASKTNSFCSRILDNLSGGIASSERIDGLGKGIGEFLRSRLVDVPLKFLERGQIS
jgi:Acyclic terpene utilisation family protein AtuA